MSNIFQVTAPLVIRSPDGVKKIMAEFFPHPEGLLYFDLYWHELGPESAFHVITGEIDGEGPWKIANHVITVLGCQGTDPDLAATWENWQSLINSPVSGYPEPGMVNAIARKAGASINT